MDLLIDTSKEDDVLELINKLNSLDELDTEFLSLIDRLVISLSEIEDVEELHENMLKIDALTYNQLYERHPEKTGELILKFISYIDSQGWPFSYTDKLADKYLTIFVNINEIDIKEKILISLLRLGVSHNRWYVMESFVKALYKVKDEGQAYSIYYNLKDEEYDLNSIQSNIYIEKKSYSQFLENYSANALFINYSQRNLS
jgi:eukaryotic-like serine/threonine-protein kinase